MAYKFKYIIIREKPYNMGQTMAQVNVSHLNKKGANAKWDELEKTFPPDKYAGCLNECNHEMREFLNAP
jgi:hypothetical protein